jgi:LysR family transcriptional regulator, cyn operon transcriptional activator
MELRHLRYFAALAEQLHFTKAARQMHITQSTLSHQIRQLEQEIGSPLFNRTGRAVLLTSAGRQFHGHCTRILRDVTSAKLALQELDALQRGTLSIGVIHTFYRNVLLPVLGEFVRSHPNVRISVEETTTPAIEAGLVAGTLDLGIGVAPHHSGELVSEPLFEESFVAVAGRRHPLARHRQIALRELAAEPLAMLSQAFATRRLIDLHLDAIRVAPDIRFQSNSIEAVLDLVKASRLLSILPATSARNFGGIVTIDIVKPTPRRACALLWLRDSHRSAAALAMATALKRRLAAPG